MNQQWFERVCMSALGHRTSQEETYDLARLVLQRGIPGDFVECGVYAGASCALMAKAIMDWCPEVAWGMARAIMDHRSFEEANESHADISVRRVHLFDSFAGIPPPGPHDIELASNGGGESAVSIEGVKANMVTWGIPEELLVYHPGLFELSVKAWIEPRPHGIALLRLDGDLYESTRVCMEHLYPMVSPGGYVIVDDFNLSGCRKAVMEVMKDQIAPVVWRKPV